MTTLIDHNKLLKRIAKERLSPYGIFQQGQSRTFLYDKGWYTVVIEFQPSSWSKGTYLNIGVDFNFYPRNDFSFAYGYREKGFEEFKSEEQFTTLVNELCDLALARVQELEKKFKDPAAALKIMDKEKNENTWRLYEVGVLNALDCDFNKAQKQLKKLSKEKCEYEWEVERKEVVDEIISWLRQEDLFFENMKGLVYKTRQLKKLPVTVPENLFIRKITPAATGRNWVNKLFGAKEN